MRKLMWFTIGFAGTCGLCAYGMMEPWLLPAFIAVIILLIIGAVSVRKRQLVRIVIALLTGCMAAVFWFGIFHFSIICLPALFDSGRRCPGGSCLIAKSDNIPAPVL